MAAGRGPGAPARRPSESRGRGASAAPAVGERALARVDDAGARRRLRVARLAAVARGAQARVADRRTEAADPDLADIAYLALNYRARRDLALTCSARARPSTQLDFARRRRGDLFGATQRHRDPILARLEVREPE